MKNSDTNLIPRSDLETLLADYATGLLDKGLTARVEASLTAFPDLQQEADSMRSAFSMVSRDARNASIDAQTRNLSVYVVNALSKPKRNRYRHLGWLAPAAVAALLLVIFNVGGLLNTTDILSNTAASSENQIAVDAIQPTTTDTVLDVAPAKTADTAESTTKPRSARKRGTQLTREELILDDLVSDQIVDRIASEIPDASEADAFSFTDAEIDVLLAAVTSNETL